MRKTVKATKGVKTHTLASMKASLLKNPKVKAAYDGMAQEFAIVAQIVKARTDAGLTQAELAARMGTKQSFIARLESGRDLPTLKTLNRVAEATGKRAKVTLVAAE
jgi:ribosome-binding protein aMBF1 (putative translation factor)